MIWECTQPPEICNCVCCENTRLKARLDEVETENAVLRAHECPPCAHCGPYEKCLAADFPPHA